ncbi:hypothetical protein DPMN_050489 [Dreissena polymorpha]|uniref:Uncharacterized protein n=1 Tax=Dreissena polymorpha TaxID=45954 RepID=A0A9D4CHA5_DREPO|nr:hypothetical protein DPMN_050489 [Dreissena polymorpha]
MHRNVCSTSSSNLICFSFQRDVEDIRTVCQNSLQCPTLSCLIPGLKSSGGENVDFDDLACRFEELKQNSEHIERTGTMYILKLF